MHSTHISIHTSIHYLVLRWMFFSSSFGSLLKQIEKYNLNYLSIIVSANTNHSISKATTLRFPKEIPLIHHLSCLLHLAINGKKSFDISQGVSSLHFITELQIWPGKYCLLQLLGPEIQRLITLKTFAWWGTPTEVSFHKFRLQFCSLSTNSIVPLGL